MDADIELRDQSKVVGLINQYEESLERRRLEDDEADIGPEARAAMDPSAPKMHKIYKESL